MIDNETFLKTVFGPAYQRAHVTAFTEDPATLDTDGKRHLWAGGPWSRYRSHLNGKTNNYFAISLFKGRKRRKQDFDATYCIVVDDVCEKVPEDKLDRLPPPSWRLETSPGNEQWGYLLFYPETDRGRVEALLNGLVAAGITEDGKDPGMKGVTRYVRLPQGVNTKARHHKDGRPWQHRLLEWAPDRAYTLEDMAEPFGIDLDQQAEELHDYIDRANDPALDALNEIGLLKHHLGKGRWEITCPWQHEHSDRADTGAAYLTLDDGSRVFKCHHGHCEARTWQDLQDYLSDNTEGLEAALASELGFEALPDDGSNEDFGPKPARAPLEIRSPDFNLSRLPPRPWVLGHIALAEKVTVMVAPPGAGKSTFALAMGLAVATGRKDITGLEARVTGPAWVINNEDDDDELHRRLAALMMYWGIEPAAAEGRLFLNSGVDRPFIIAKRLRESEMRAMDRDRVIELIRRHGIKLLVVDPFAETHTANENSNEEMILVARMYREIAQQAHCAVVLVHHTRKLPSGDSTGHVGNMESGRGASSLTGVARVIVTLYGMSEKDAAVYGRLNDRHRYVRLDDAKANLSLASPVARWFRKESVDLWNGDAVGVLVPQELRPVAVEWEDRALEVAVDELKGAIDEGHPGVPVNTVVTALFDDPMTGGEGMSKSTIRRRLLELLGEWQETAGWRLKVEDDPGLGRGGKTRLWVVGHVFSSEVADK